MAAPAEGQEGAERVELRFPVAAREQSPLAAVVELVVIVALALGLTWLVQQYIVKSYRIPTGSMRTTVDEGDRVLAARFLGWFADPERGDVIVFHPPGRRRRAAAGRAHAGERDVHQARRRTARARPCRRIDDHVLICRAPRVACRALREPYATRLHERFRARSRAARRLLRARRQPP